MPQISPPNPSSAPSPAAGTASHRARRRVSAWFDAKRGNRSDRQILRDVSGTFGLNVAYSGLGLGLGVALARLLGAAGFGAYNYAIAWISLLTTGVVFGLDRLLVREVAAYRTNGDWGRMHGVLRWATGVVLAAAIGFAAAGVGLSHLLGSRVDPLMLGTVRVALLLLPFMALMRLRQSAMQGLLHVVSGQVAETLLLPILLLTGIGMAYLVLGPRLTPQWAMGVNVIATAGSFLFGTWLLYRAIPTKARAATPTYDVSVWVKAALPLLVATGLQVLNGRLDTLLLGALRGAAAVGIYSVAARWGQFLTFVQTALTPALGPRIASLEASGDRVELQRVVTRWTRMTMLASAPLVIVLLGASHWLLLLYGREFMQGQRALMILGLGQIFNVAAGPVAWLLMMTGHARDTANSLAISVVVNALLNVVLIPHLGLDGAAIASASSIITWNTLMAILVHRRLGIHATVLGRLGARA